MPPPAYFATDRMLGLGAVHTSPPRIHQTLRITPAMAAGVSKTLRDVSDIVAMQEQWEIANYKPEYNFVVRQYAIGKGHSVSVLGAVAKSIRFSDLRKKPTHCNGLERSRRRG
jgi:hypothetical protein